MTYIEHCLYYYNQYDLNKLISLDEKILIKLLA
jgi:hypothetical protein